MKARFDKTERTGVNRIEEIFLGFGWIPRRILESDVGIDMEVEVVEAGMPNGKLIAVQIKTGKSYFKRTKTGNIAFYPDPLHLDYWLKHCLPVLLVIDDPEDNLTLWQEVTPDSIRKSAKGNKIIIPAHQQLTVAAKETIAELNKLPPFLEKIQRLSVHYDIMKRIDDGEKIVVELEDWVNKSIGKAYISVKSVDFLDAETVLMEGGYIFFSGVEDLHKLFPWADFSLDDDFYEEHDEQDWMDNYAIYDKEDDCYRSASMTFREYQEKLPAIRAVEMGSGEVHLYRLEMSLNEIGEAFFKLNVYLAEDEIDE
jgi:hypothetical protein